MSSLVRLLLRPISRTLLNHVALQMKTRRKYLMSRLSKHQQNYCMVLSTNVTCLQELVSTQWSVNRYHDRLLNTIFFFQAEKYEASVFGSCPRVYCMGCNVVPCGRSDLPGLDTVKLFCPNCNDIYVPASSRFQGVDGQSLPALTMCVAL